MLCDIFLSLRKGKPQRGRELAQNYEAVLVTRVASARQHPIGLGG